MADDIYIQLVQALSDPELFHNMVQHYLKPTWEHFSPTSFYATVTPVPNDTPDIG